MNARLIMVASATLCLAASAATFAQPGLTSASTPQASAQPGLTSTSEPRGSWFGAAPQPPATAPRSIRVTPTMSPDTDQQAQPPQPAQNVAPTTPAPPVPQPGRGSFMQPRGQLINVKVEFTITDQAGTKPPTKKTMTMVVADRESSRIRTNVDYYTTRGNRQVPLSVDVNPYVEGNKIRLDFSIEYATSEEAESPTAPGPKTTVSERLAAVFDSGVPMVVAQSSDAYSDRKVTIEIKATIMK